MLGVSRPTWNICQLGAVFFFNFFSYFTLSALSQTIIESVSQTEGINPHAGYYAAFLTYLVFTIGHFIATPIVEVITPKWSIVIGLIGYALYEVAFLWMNEYFLYFSAACGGFCGSLLFTGQFDYLAQNSKANTLDRNSSTLWGLSQISLTFGGAYLLIIYQFHGGTGYDMSLVRLLVCSFLGLTLLAMVIAFFLPKPVYKTEKYKVSYLEHLSEIVKISFERNLLFLFFLFCYTGLELSYFSLVFPTMVSFTKKLGHNRDLNAIVPMCAGIGNLFTCFILSALGSKIRVFGRKKIVVLGSICHMTCFLLAFLTFPDQSPLQPTDDVAYYPPSVIIVVVCGFLQGVGDTILNQQCYTMISDIFDHDKRIEAFAVYRFFQSAASCIGMFYAAHAYLHTHIIILTLFCILGTVTFFGVQVPEKMLLAQSAATHGEEEEEENDDRQSSF